MRFPLPSVLVLFTILLLSRADIDQEEEKLPTKCHVCKHLVQELQDELKRSARSKDIFRTGQIFQEQRKEINYQRSEVRLNEALENACSNVLDYKVHKDKIKALRYEKKESVTFNTLKGLKNRGVKVDLGFPDEMWDSPDAEVTRLKSRCELMVERYEDDLTEWYWHHQTENLTHWLCLERVLNRGEEDCFNETEPEKRDKDDEDSKKEDLEEGRKESDQDKKKSRRKEKEKRKDGKTNENSIGKEKSESKSSKSKGSDTEKIQRLIEEQAWEQQERRNARKNDFVQKMDEVKRMKFQKRLRDINDIDRLRRELRKIRTQEMTEDDYTPKEPWELDLDTRLPEDTLKEMRRRRLDRMNDLEDLRGELQMRVVDTEEDFDEPHSFILRDLRHRYMDEAEEIRDPKELKKRIDDLDALSAIFARGSGHRRDRHHRSGRDEL